MTAPALSFDMPDLGPHLAALSDAQLDMLDFGVIGFDGDTVVCRYNKLESNDAGLSQQRVLNQPLFTNVAPCMNNFMVAQRFDDALDQGALLDDTIAYVLTLRMRPIKVSLRLIAVPGAAVRYVLVRRQK
jgi:photoactive yellow protein